MVKVKYPYQNLSLKNIKGEKWKDIPDLQDHYQVSNYGRIKRLQYEMLYKNGAIYLKPEKIIKPTIVKHFNKFKNDYSNFLINRVIFKKRKHNFTNARLVYYSFVEQFDLADHTIAIICKDENNFNIRPANLKKVSAGEKKQRSITRKRFRSPFLDLTPASRKKIRKAIVKTVSKRVSQYSSDGRTLIKTYPSMAAAQRATGVHYITIGSRASGKGKTAGGYIWKWEKEEHS